MAYKKKWTKKKKPLKASNIFGNKNAKAQAKQIYALNKKVNYIQKTTSPETKTFNGVLCYFDNLNSATNELLPQYNHRYDLYRERIFNTSLKKYLRLDGDLLRVKNIYLYGYFGLKTWTYLTDTVPQQELNIPKDAYFKVVVARVVKGGSNYPSVLASDLPNVSPSGTALEYSEGVPINVINGPLNEGVSSQIQILKKKVIKITPAKTSKMFKIKLFNSKKCNLNYRKTIAGMYSQGEIFVYLQYMCPVALYHTVGQGQECIAPRVVAQINYKLVYSDDGTEIIDNL